jgi:tetratricopeptide (TPR) repeat protein
MTVSVRVPYAWRCERCGRECRAPIWRIIDGRERADVLATRGQGLATADCTFCGAIAHIDAPLLVLRPGVTAPLLLALSLAELRSGALTSAGPLLQEAGQAGAFGVDDFGVWQPLALPRTLLPVVLARDLNRDLSDPEAARQQLERDGSPAAVHYKIFLNHLAGERNTVSAKELLRALSMSLPAQLAELVRTHPELTGSTQIRDVGREDLRAHAGTPIEHILRARQQLLDDLCDGSTSPSAAIDRYFGSLDHFGGDMRSRLFEMDERVRATQGPEGIPLAREALELARQLGEQEVETGLAADLGERLVAVVSARFDADVLEEALRALELALSRLPEGSLLWMITANNLANAHHLRADGDRLEVWEAAHDLLARASMFNRAEHLEIWARLQTNYGLLLAERPGAGPDDLSSGIDRIRAGLEERSPKRNAVDWAYSMICLGFLLYRRAAPGDHQEAEKCYRGALRHLRANHEPSLWAQLQCNLGELLLSREPADARGAWKAANAARQLAATLPGLLDTSRVTWLLARASDLLKGRHNAESIQLRREALASAPPLLEPARHLDIAGDLLNALATAQRWSEAADVAADMITAMDALYDAQVTVAGRRSVIARWPALARWTASVLANAGRPERAVEAIERGLARELSPGRARRGRTARAGAHRPGVGPAISTGTGPVPVLARGTIGCDGLRAYPGRGRTGCRRAWPARGDRRDSRDPRLRTFLAHGHARGHRPGRWRDAARVSGERALGQLRPGDPAQSTRRRPGRTRCPGHPSPRGH